MKLHTLPVVGVLLMCFICCASGVVAAQPDADGRAIELLFLGDRGHHNPSQRANVLKRSMGTKAIHITYTENLDDLNDETLGKYDGLMVYANIGHISPAQRKAKERKKWKDLGLVRIDLMVLPKYVANLKDCEIASKKEVDK